MQQYEKVMKMAAKNFFALVLVLVLGLAVPIAASPEIITCTSCEGTGRVPCPGRQYVPFGYMCSRCHVRGSTRQHGMANCGMCGGRGRHAVHVPHRCVSCSGFGTETCQGTITITGGRGVCGMCSREVIEGTLDWVLCMATIACRVCGGAGHNDPNAPPDPPPAPIPEPEPELEPVPEPAPEPAPEPPPQVSINVTIDGQPVVFPGGQGPEIVGGRTLVPVRGVFEMLGFGVDWDAGTRTAVISSTAHEIRITIDSDVFTVNGQNRALDVPAQIIGGRTMVPIRAPLESIGVNVDWDNATSTVLISGAASAPVQPPTPPSDISAPAPQILRVTYGATWGSVYFPHNFTNDDYTATFIINHPSAFPDGYGFAMIQPIEPVLDGFWDFYDENGDAIGFYPISPNTWFEFESTFPGRQAGGGIRISGLYPRTPGVSFYIGNVVVRNSAGVVVLSEDFSGVTARPGEGDVAYVAGAAQTPPGGYGRLEVVPTVGTTP